MSRRSRRFRATVEVPELGTVEIRGLSPDEFGALPIDPPTPEEIATRQKHAHPVFLAVIAAGLVRPSLSEDQIVALPPASRELLADAIMRAHPAGRRLYLKHLARTGS